MCLNDKRWTIAVNDSISRGINRIAEEDHWRYGQRCSQYSSKKVMVVVLFFKFFFNTITFLRAFSMLVFGAKVAKNHANWSELESKSVVQRSTGSG